jgi:hypothetical protein
MISDMGPNPFESSRLESQQFVSDERCRVHSSDSLTPTDSRGVQSGTLVENAIEVGGVTKTVVGMSDTEDDATSHERGQYDCIAERGPSDSDPGLRVRKGTTRGPVTTNESTPLLSQY